MASRTTDDKQLQMAEVLPDIQYMDGLIFAVAACPEIPMPEQWMPWVLRSDLNMAIDKKQADELADFLMGRLRDTLDEMRKNQRLLPDTCQWGGTKSQQEALKNWLKGLLTGHQQLEKQWQQAWNMRDGTLDLNSLATRLTRCLKLFSTLANPDIVLQLASDEKRKTLLDSLPQLAASLPAMLREYVDISGELVQVLPNQFEVVPKSEL